MTRREKLEEQYEDALFALLMDDIADEEGQALLEENERLKHDPSAAVPEELDKKCRKIIRNTFRKEQGRAFGRASYRMFQRVAVVAVLAALLFTVAYAAVPEFQVAVKNLVLTLTETDTSTDMGLTPQTGYPASSTDIFRFTIPEIPTGYELVASSETATERFYWYENSDGDVFSVDILRGNESTILSTDTEDAQNVTNILVNGYSGICTEKDGAVQVTWVDTDQIVFQSIYATALGMDQVLELAQAIKYVA